jgi:hypothetical protein
MVDLVGFGVLDELREPHLGRLELEELPLHEAPQPNGPCTARAAFRVVPITR